LETNEGNLPVEKLVNSITKLQLEINKVEKLEKGTIYHWFKFTLSIRTILPFLRFPLHIREKS